MKTFIDLKLGDILYIVDIGYKSAEGPQVRIEKVTSLIIEKDQFQVNKYYGYAEYTYLMNIPVLEAEKEDIKRDNNKYITINPDKVKNLLKEAGIKLIKSYEDSISSYQDNIKKTRELYFEYLNYK